ncbi:hypothetical protein SAMN02799630_00986 [Paenibacillus sp. UNCCL117]|uniref:hypothetical protein n=1 Tax=unclassified Paenibacillus TaxID=185978 RepID=UPI0008811717|nr:MULTISPECIES: hypothetical protein [unclassified Paenibacillus]SDC27594.1 hypothetical protein SAMN04488602_101788 [Paenibacillus sp. cl123]SFW20361.1 hypothetical protein SAMN02799630_00986 [Paenibacillus sp. UNCCL117]
MNFINNVHVEIQDAILSGCLNEGIIEWYIDIKCGSFFTVDGIEAKPRIYMENQLWDISSINEITKKSLVIEVGCEPTAKTIMPGHRLSCIYVFQHNVLYDNIIEFYESANALKVRWKAATKDSYDPYEINIDTIIQFLGISLGQLTKEEAEDILDFDTTGLSYCEEDGELYLLPSD